MVLNLKCVSSLTMILNRIIHQPLLDTSEAFSLSWTADNYNSLYLTLQGICLTNMQQFNGWHDSWVANAGQWNIYDPQCPKNTWILCQGRFRHCVLFVLFFLFFSLMGHCHRSLEVIRSSLVENETWYLIKRQRFPLQTKTQTPNEFCQERVYVLKNVPHPNQITLASIF